MAEGVHRALPGAEVVLCPMADGGEGTVDAIAAATGAEIRQATVRGPLPGQEVTARWALLKAGSHGFSEAAAEGQGLQGGVPTGVIEMAQASGYSLVPPDRRDPMKTTTYGTGQLIREALNAGCGQMIVGIGGSATVDGGTGMAAALGYRFLDDDGGALEPSGGTLAGMRSIDEAGRDRRLDGVRILVASDVDNPLVGPNGAARVFGPQKGAGPSEVEELERGLENLAGLLKDRGRDIADAPGAGAAGGLGGGLVAFCGARVASGVKLIASLTGLRGKVEGADLVLTGEGSYDSQTAMGKAPAGVAAVAWEAGVPVILVAGSVSEAGEGPSIPAFCVITGPMDLGEAMSNARELVASGVARLLELPNVCGT